MLDRYKSGEDFVNHSRSEPFIFFFSQCKAQELFWKEPEIIQTEAFSSPQMGFESR
jgi:hypothetical protein